MALVFPWKESLFLGLGEELESADCVPALHSCRVYEPSLRIVSVSVHLDNMAYFTPAIVRLDEEWGDVRESWSMGCRCECHSRGYRQLMLSIWVPYSGEEMLKIWLYVRPAYNWRAATLWVTNLHCIMTHSMGSQSNYPGWENGNAKLDLRPSENTENTGCNAVLIARWMYKGQHYSVYRIAANSLKTLCYWSVYLPKSYVCNVPPDMSITKRMSREMDGWVKKADVYGVTKSGQSCQCRKWQDWENWDESAIESQISDAEASEIGINRYRCVSEQYMKEMTPSVCSGERMWLKAAFEIKQVNCNSTVTINFK